MHRFFVNSSAISGDSIVITDPGLLHHIKDVIRLKKGDSVTLFDERANEYDGDITQCLPDQTVVRIQRKITGKSSGGGRIYLAVACALPKKSKFDSIVDGLTQLGVDRIIPLITERVVVRLDQKNSCAKRLRWEKIALQASQQSQRSTLPLIDEPMNFSDMIMRCADFEYKLLPTLGHERKSIHQIFSSSLKARVLVSIGPEGDFSENEVRRALHARFIPVTLGDLVLRVETAALAVAAIIKSYENR